MRSISNVMLLASSCNLQVRIFAAISSSLVGFSVVDSYPVHRFTRAVPVSINQDL